MKARKLIDGAAFGPDVVRALGQAFDEAWTEIGGNFGSDPKVVEDAASVLPRPCCQSPQRTVRPTRNMTGGDMLAPKCSG
jgi:hypothetical protein